MNKEISLIRVLKEKGDETVNEQIERLQESLDFVKERYRDRENDDDVDEPDEEEPGIALEDQLRITEQSAKAIDILSSHQLSTVWQTCSKNTFGKTYQAFLSRFRTIKHDHCLQDSTSESCCSVDLSSRNS
jgi:hypothetical protein